MTAAAETLVVVDPLQGRWTAELDGDFIVFLIGATVYDPAGLLGYTRHGEAGSGVIVQYWRSFEALESYARNPGARHAPVWRAWNRLGSEDRAGAGIWHETFKVVAGNYEAIYQNMPAMGLQRAGRPLTVSEAMDSARARITN